MLELFSDDTKYKTWRELWVALAESQRELGLNISEEQINQLKKYKNNIDYDTIRQKEKEIKHDVMAHIHAYGQQCPKARPIIHLGATSSYVVDNTDIILMYKGLSIIRKKIINILDWLSKFALKYKALPTLGFTHFQPAQLVTVGKRACLWIQDLLMDLEELDYHLSKARLLGSKGATGTQASFLELFNGDNEKVKLLEKLIAEKMGYNDFFPIVGQTYPRKLDSFILNILSGIAQSSYKFANDIRLLQHLNEIEEPFDKKQVGSSAMAYKRNPVKSERICGLARYVIINSLNPAVTSSTQWLERTLDDSSNKRISIPEGFLAVDAILNIYLSIISGIEVYPKVIEKHVKSELPFIASENILMKAVTNGGDRQKLHEKIRMYSMQSVEKMKLEGFENDLIKRVKEDKEFILTEDELKDIIEPVKYIGRAPQQVEDFIEYYIKPVISLNNHYNSEKVEMDV